LYRYDPRFPTVQGVLRRGVQVEGLREFILGQGASRRITDMEWDKFWTINKRVIDPIAPRFFAIDSNNSVRLTLNGLNLKPDEVIGLPVAMHPKNPDLGEKIMRLSSKLLLEKDDVKLMNVGDEVTLMRYGNIIIRHINVASDGDIISVEADNNPEGDFKKTKLKITWLAHTVS